MINNDWKPILENEFNKDYFLSLKNFVEAEYKSGIVYPQKENIFNAFKLTPRSNVKVVILGQDPYHNEGQAHGLSFSVPKGVDIPPSLKNIYKEIEDELGVKCPTNGNLEYLSAQGVLLINSVLTVRANEAASHRNKGWERFTDSIISSLNEIDRPIVYLLWGNPSRAKKSLITNSSHLVLEAAHPSPLSAYRGFFGCGHFKAANDFLAANGLTPIDWGKVGE